MGAQMKAQDSQQIAHEQAQEQVAGGYAVGDEQWSDDELRASHMLTGVEADKVAGSLEGVLGDGLAVKLIDCVEPFGD